MLFITYISIWKNVRYIYTGIATMVSWYYSSSAVRLLTLLKGCQVAFHKCGINLCVLRTLLWLDRNFPLSVHWDVFASLSFIMTLKRDSRILLQGLLYFGFKPQTTRFHYHRIFTKKGFKMQSQTQKCFILALVRKSQLDVGGTNQKQSGGT